MNYIITVYRTQGMAMQNFNTDNLPAAIAKALTFKTDRFVKKVEISVLLHVFRSDIS